MSVRHIDVFLRGSYILYESDIFFKSNGAAQGFYKENNYLKKITKNASEFKLIINSFKFIASVKTMIYGDLKNTKIIIFQNLKII